MSAESPRAATRPAMPARHYGLDWLRIGAFVLLILFHIGMYFTPGNWVVKTDHPIAWLALPMAAVTPWRLALLFVVSGFASHALLARLGGPAAFLRQRSLRLLLPLGFAMAVVIPPQSWVRLAGDHGYAASFWHFWANDYFRFGQLHGITLPAWEHLWFVAYLWAYTALLVAGIAFAPAWARARAARAVEALGKGSRLLWLPLCYFLPVRVAATFTVGESHGLFDDWLSDLVFLPAFLFGFALAATPSLWPAIARLWRPALLLALAGYAGLAAFEIAYPADIVAPHLPTALSRAATALTLWSAILVLLHVGQTLLNRDHPWRARLAEAVFPVYIVHQSAIVVAGWWLLGRGYPPLAEFALIVAATAGSCALFYVAARSIPWLAPFAGLSPKRRAAAPAALVPPLPAA